MDTDRFIVNIKTEDIYKGAANDAEKKFHTWNSEIEKPLPKNENRKVITLMKDELGGRISTEFIGLEDSYL